MENVEIFKKRLLYQSQHRGTREMDLLLGGFAQTLDTLCLDELQQFEILLSFPDHALYCVFFEKGPLLQGMSKSLVEKIRTFIESR
ncbi:MAG: succinate dehydrogenase assembly factor 2 [Proteobacteria bacterium]|nr:succinate dehydrogenase assembly factor 2 [Pseudomonadota bacterium]